MVHQKQPLQTSFTRGKVSLLWEIGLAESKDDKYCRIKSTGPDALEEVRDPSLPNNRTIGFHCVKLICKLLKALMI